MAKRHDISADLARQLLDYDPETGILRWKVRTTEHFRPTRKQTAADRCKNWNSRYAGKVAGAVIQRGYIGVGIFNRRYLAHRLIWLIMTGEWPSGEVDHRFGNPSDNRWCKLRAATPSQNQHNRARSKRNKSGYTGVSWHAGAKKWRAAICKERKSIFLGFFATAGEAGDAYKEAKRQLHTFQPELREVA